MILKKKIAPLVLALAFACTTLAPSFASASEVDHALASNPTATLSAIDAMHLTPLSDAQAGEVRGEGWIVSFLIKAASNMGIKGAEVALNGSASPAELRANYPGVYGWVLSFFPWAISPQIVY